MPRNDLHSSGFFSCEGQLTGLTISPGALVPPFDHNHTSYSAVVGQSQFTISATYGSDVTLHILGEDGSAIPDADSSIAGHQIDLDAGVTVISLRLSTRDGNYTIGHYTIWVNRASAPGAPVIESISPGGQALTVTWTAPEETGGADIASYDVRFIESDSADKSDDNWTVTTEVWTGGARRYTITRLEADVSYDVQVRAVHGAGAGIWSETVVGTPEALSDTCLQIITESATIVGAWESGCESTARVGSYARFYAFTLDEPGDVAVTLESEVDTYLYIREGEGADGYIVREDDDDDHSDFILASSTDSGILESLERGTYTIEATTYDTGEGGDFTLDLQIGPEIEPVEARPAALSAGSSHACALDLNGVISCQGVDDSAQVTGLPASGVFTAISVGERHSCAIDLGGRVHCWGSDEHRQVSDQPTSGEFIAVGAGARHTCAIDLGGSVHCWGSDEHGQSSPPTEGRFVAVGAGDSYTCGLLSDGTLECWGGTFEPIADSCRIYLPQDGSLPAIMEGSWIEECVYPEPIPDTEDGDRYYRYVRFRVNSLTSWIATVTSDKDTYMLLWEIDAATDEWRIVDENDNMAPGNTNSRIQWTPTEGNLYVIDVTTYTADTLGDFTLTIDIEGGTPQGSSNSMEYSDIPNRQTIERHRP